MLFQNYFVKHYSLIKHKITYIISKNQRCIKFSIHNNNSLLYSYKNIKNKKTKLNNVSLLYIFFSLNYYIYIEQYILFYKKFFIKNKLEIFKTKLKVLKFKKNIF